MPAALPHRYQTHPGVVVGIDHVEEAEIYLTVRLVSGLRVLAPANCDHWDVGQDIEVLMDAAVGCSFLGLAVRQPRLPRAASGTASARRCSA